MYTYIAPIDNPQPPSACVCDSSEVLGMTQIDKF